MHLSKLIPLIVFLTGISLAIASAQDIYTAVEPKPLTLADGSRSNDDDIVLPPSEGPTTTMAYSDSKNPNDAKNKPSIEIRNDQAVSATENKFHYGFRLTLRGV